MKNLVCSDPCPCTSGSGLYLCLHQAELSIVIRINISRTASFSWSLQCSINRYACCFAGLRVWVLGLNCSRLYSGAVSRERRSCLSGGASGASVGIAPGGSDAFLGLAGPGTCATHRMLRFSDLGIPLLMYPVIWYCIGTGCSGTVLAAVLWLFHTEQTLRLSARLLRLCRWNGAWRSVSVFWVSSDNFTGAGRSALGLHSCALGLFGRYSRQEY